ncbi:MULTISPECIES: CoA transferase [unclassified Mycobacterium]|uniref:CaiB/BaiF CoA-transferase family protein n=1 Tax=unclassified Mycobacterium TaxID=2642494 RepID=UPI0029C814EE|nr:MULTISPECIES: CoA transferase [unclassified Mycobacterium]
MVGSQRALDGLRVIDFGQYIAGPLAAMMLADNGAEVIRVDPPGGPRWRHPANAVLQRGKSSIVLDLKNGSDQQVAKDLVASADVLIEGFRPGVMERLGVGAAAMCQANPRLLYCSLPGFAADDPRADLPAWEGILGAATGHYTPGVALSWASSGPTDPSYSALPLASSFGAVVAVNSILAGLIARERSGLGQEIEVPLFGAMFEGIGNAAQKLPMPQTPFGHAACAIEAQAADGRWCYLVMATRRQFRKFAAAVFPQEWRDAGLGDPIRLEQDEALAAEARKRIIGLLAERPSDEWDRLINAAGVPFSVCQTSREWLADPHARAARVVIDVDDPELGPTAQFGYAVSLDRTPPRANGPRRPLDSDRDRILVDLADRRSRPTPAPPTPSVQLTRALEGMRVVDTTLVLAGPSVGRVLAEFGADVIKINEPAYWVVGHLHTNSGKRTALVDATSSGGKDVLTGLLERADVFVQNCSQGIAERIGLGERDVRAHRPDIVYCSVSTYNYDGPRGGYRGYEPLGQAPTGMMLRWGGGQPRLYRFTICDYGTGHLAATAVLLALYHRSVRGEGQHVQSSLVQAGSHHQLPFLVGFDGREWDEPQGPEAKGNGPLDRLYQTADGWFYLAAVADGDDIRLIEVTGLSGLDADSLAACFAEGTVEKWVDRLREAGIAAHALVDIDDLMDDDYVRATGLSVVRHHDGVGPVRMVGPAPRLSRTPVLITHPVPPPGADTRDVVTEAGLAHRYEELRSSGAVADSLPPGEIVVY